MRRLAIPLFVVAWLSAAEWKIFERLFFANEPSAAFVVESVRGVLSGTPVSKSWQHRVLAPNLVRLLGGPTLSAVEWFGLVMLLAANLLLFALAMRAGRGWSPPPTWTALAAVAVYGFLRFVLAYKLEYPWDWIDQIIFMLFGVVAREERPTHAVGALALVGALNHETILYVPLWYLVGGTKRSIAIGLGLSAPVVGVIAALRALLYRGRPDLPDQVFEPPIPLLENHFHVAHNLNALFVDNLRYGRIHLSLLFIGATAAALTVMRRAGWRRVGSFVLAILGSVVAFGYVNETRHYLVLVAFLSTYVLTAMRDRGALASARSAASEV